MTKMFTNDEVVRKRKEIVRKFSLLTGTRPDELSDANTLLGLTHCAMLEKTLKETDLAVLGDAAGIVSDFIRSHKLDAASISIEGLRKILSDFEALVRSRTEKLPLVLRPVELIDEFYAELDSKKIDSDHLCRKMLVELKRSFMQIIDEQSPYALHPSHTETRVAPAERVVDVSVATDLALILIFPCESADHKHEFVERVRLIFEGYRDSIFGNPRGLVSLARDGSDDALVHMESEVLDSLGKMRTLSRDAEHLFDEIVKNIEASTHLFLKEEMKKLRDYIASLKQLREKLTCPIDEIRDLFAYIYGNLQSVRGRGCPCWSLFRSYRDVPVARMWESVLAEVETGLSHALPGRHGGSVRRAAVAGKHLAEAVPNENSGRNRGHAPPGTRV